MFLAIVSHSAADLDFDLQESASKCEGPLKDVKNLLRGKNIFVEVDLLSKDHHRHISLKLPNVKFDFDVSVRHCLLSTHTLKLCSTLGTHLHTMKRTHHFDFEIRC